MADDPITALLSLDAAKDALNITTTKDDVELADYISAATDLIEAQVGAVLFRSVTRQVRASGGVLRLPITPVRALTAMSPVMDGGVPYALAGLTVGSDGVVRSANRVSIFPDLYEVTWTVGLVGPPPPRMVQAAKVLVAHLWATQRGPSAPGLSRSVDEYDPTSAYTMPHRVVELLQWDMTGPLVG